MHLERPFPLTPALSPGERETVAGAGNGPLSLEYRQIGGSYSLSSGERVRLRGNSRPDCVDTPAFY